jgi:hypothetical protein
MENPSPARLMRSRFMTFGLWASIVAFVLIEGDALLDQSEIGHASILFMLGTACLAAAACIALFAIISAVGLAVSAAFSEELHQQQQSASGQDAPAATAFQIIRPPATQAPERSRPRGRQQPRPVRTFAGELRKASPRSL